ncbi:unnamed protein product, partial [Meganyctiphanes norvegica]
DFSACFGLTGYVEVEDVFGGGPPTCMRFTEEKGNYETQKFRCQLDGLSVGLSTHLATALDQGGLLFNLNYYINAHSDLTDEAFFVDGTDAGHEGFWTWTDPTVSAMDMNSMFWGPGQPDQGTVANQACLYTPDFLLNDCKDSINIKAICQV